MKICKYCRFRIQDGVEVWYNLYCRAIIKEGTKINPVTGRDENKEYPHPYCKKINTDGNCELYDDRRLIFAIIDRTRWWIKQQNWRGRLRLALARACWWIGGVRDLRP